MRLQETGERGDPRDAARTDYVLGGEQKSLHRLRGGTQGTGRRARSPLPTPDTTAACSLPSQFAWARNLRSGEPVEIRLSGTRRSADVQVSTDEAGVVEYLGVMARDNRQFAKFNEIGFDEHGVPSPGDLHLAWAAGTRVVALTQR